MEYRSGSEIKNCCLSKWIDSQRLVSTKYLLFFFFTNCTYRVTRATQLFENLLSLTVRAGNNTIQRRSSDSTLTIPFQQTFRNEDAIPLGSEDQAQNFIFCGCGWPDHMLLPKGTPDGLLCDLFVMLNDYQQDRVRYHYNVPIEQRIHASLTVNSIHP